MRKLEDVAHDLALCLWRYTANYAGSPFKEDAEKVLLEYKGLTSEVKPELPHWSALETRIMIILMNEERSLSQITDETSQIMEAVKSLGVGKDVNDKLEQIVKLAKRLQNNKLD